jgi:hypothetical protein|tara:strand:+ start:16124 stop:16339 length:216 start_codon:yes stop_codon:yes gene_type:complete
MTTLIVTLVLGVGAVIYLIRIGRQLEKSGSYKTALGIHGKINKARDEIIKKRNIDHKRLDDNPRSVFGADD